MRYENIKIINALAMNGSATSTILDLRNVVNLSLQFIVSGASSPTGTVSIQFANDCTPGVNGPISGGNFAVDAAAPAPPTVTANGTKILNFANVGHAFCQVVYTTGTGNGTLNVIGSTKGV